MIQVKGRERRTSQQAPQGIQLLLRVRHTRNLLLGVIDSLRNTSSQLLEHIRKTVFLGCGFTSSSLVFRVRSNTSIGIETADDAVRFGEDRGALLNEWLYGVD